MPTPTGTLRRMMLPAGFGVQVDNPWLHLLPPELADRPKDAFFLPFPFRPLAAGGELTIIRQITAEAAFLILGAVRVATQTNDLTVVNFLPALVTVTDGTQRTLMDAPVHMENFAGTAQNPAIWPWPKLIPASSQITTKLTNLDPANAFHVQLNYFGFKIY